MGLRVLEVVLHAFSRLLLCLRRVIVVAAVLVARKNVFVLIIRVGSKGTAYRPPFWLFDDDLLLLFSNIGERRPRHQSVPTSRHHHPFTTLCSRLLLRRRLLGHQFCPEFHLFLK